jgi:aryl-alcohol dehydrogenase-like predicted oxidoreductase
MQPRPLGRSGLTVAPLALGGNVFGWTADKATSFAVLDAFVDAGFNLIDTADTYSRWAPGHQGGESETIIGQWIAQSGKRDRIVLATKVGKAMGPGKVGLSRAYIRQAVEDSLRRLQTDHIDLYQAHDDDANTPLEETLAAFGELIQAGKVRAIGASNYTPARLKQALDTSMRLNLPRYETLQPLYNLIERSTFEAELGPLCASQGLGVISFFALARGFLTGKYRRPTDAGKSPRGAQIVKEYFNDRSFRILAALDAAADHVRATPAQVALAWLIARPGITAPIASATSVAQLNELLSAVSLQLPSATISALDQASA